MRSSSFICVRVTVGTYIPVSDLYCFMKKLLSEYAEYWLTIHAVDCTIVQTRDPIDCTNGLQKHEACFMSWKASMTHVGMAFVALFLTVGSLLLVDSFTLGQNTVNEENYALYPSVPRLPDTITFAGEPVDLSVNFIRERVEREFYDFLESADSIIVAKRTGRCFPPVEKMLADAGMPDDLKYILVVESKCIENAVSGANAVGPWQFIRSTGRNYSLTINRWKDERRDLHLATHAAIKFLRTLREKKFESWPLSLAAYNTGGTRIRKAMRDQTSQDYWDLYLSRETMRYVPRILAAKEIFSHPVKYFGLGPEDLWKPIPFQHVTVNVTTKRKALSAIAKDHGTHLLYVKQLNPELRRAYLPRGTHKIRIPSSQPSEI
ncbi:MAG TPA: lytic transglycosylase [Nitrospirales bacterium]|nr:lytic transglycosylase [Nitrospirales bacterium]